MSFFGNLRDRAEAVQQRQRVEEEEQRVREFQRFTKDWLKKFLEDCERLADAGDTSAWMDLACPGFPRKSAMNRHAVAKEEAESLRNLGAQVYVGDWHQDHCCTWRAEITAQWGQAPARPRPAAAGGGTGALLTHGLRHVSQEPTAVPDVQKLPFA
ncbi:unnamed protein product [Effrenium voratum]|nr:unnamed protein product [Effrenium voratum]